MVRTSTATASVSFWRDASPKPVMLNSKAAVPPLELPGPPWPAADLELVYARAERQLACR